MSETVREAGEVVTGQVIYMSPSYIEDVLAVNNELRARVARLEEALREIRHIVHDAPEDVERIVDRALGGNSATEPPLCKECGDAGVYIAPGPGYWIHHDPSVSRNHDFSERNAPAPVISVEAE